MTSITASVNILEKKQLYYQLQFEEEIYHWEVKKLSNAAAKGLCKSSIGHKLFSHGYFNTFHECFHFHYHSQLAVLIILI